MTHSTLDRFPTCTRSPHPTAHDVLYPAMQTGVPDRIQLKREFAKALRLGHFELFYQPVLDIGSGDLLGFEGLIRWRHPQRGLLLPGEFIGLAEDTGDIGAIGAWVIDRGCRDLAARKPKNLDDPAFWLSLNVSSKQFDGTLVDTVRTALRRYSIDPGLLILEITESIAIANMETASDELNDLRRLGVNVALDDFGTGFSSLSYLDALPINIIKIDRSFVSQHGNTSGRMLGAIVALGRSLDLQMIAEGIEEPGELERLRELGVAGGQGYLFAHPMSAADAATFSDERRQPRHAANTLLVAGR